jgi:GntR family transcriptional regulator
MTQLTAQAVRDLIIDRLASGSHPIGSKLPTSRQLAAELGAHRNTVAKAYQQLANLGLVTVRQGRGTFVVALLDKGNGQPLAEQVRGSLIDAIVKARRIGVTEQQLRDLVEEQIGTAYGSERRGAFVECNTADIDAAVSEIETLVGYRLAPLLLERLQRDPIRAAADYDVVFTSLFHVKEVSDCVGPVRPALDVIGVYTQPDEGALDRLAHIPPGSCVGIVVSNDEGARRFAGQINMVTAVNTRALVMPGDQEIVKLAREVDAFVCSRSRLGQVRALGLPQPVIELKFHVSSQSAARVAEALSQPRIRTLVLGA